MTILYGCILLGYLSGSVLFARVSMALLHKGYILTASKDGNPGTANAFRYGGFLCGTLTLSGDLLKGFFPVHLLVSACSPTVPPMLFALAASAPVLGHAFPVFYHFQGGKGIAVTFGCLLGLLPEWQPVACLVCAFLLFSLMIRITPHFQRTVAAYLLTLAFLFLSGQSQRSVLSFSLMSIVVSVRLLMSREPRERMLVNFPWQRRHGAETENKQPESGGKII